MTNCCMNGKNVESINDTSADMPASFLLIDYWEREGSKLVYVAGEYWRPYGYPILCYGCARSFAGCRLCV